MLKRGSIALIIGFVIVGHLWAKEKYAVLIGINDYEHERIQDLNYSEADAVYLQNVLIKYARYKPQNIRILLGENATYRNIKRDIYWLSSQVRNEDDVFFYFSGHGTRIEDMDGNEEDHMDEAFCPFETDIDDPSSVILDDEIGLWFRRIRANRIIIVLDCCHSGGAAGRDLSEDNSKGIEMGGEVQARDFVSTDSDPYVRDLTIDNKFIMTASDADEQSYENPKLGHGVFTYYLGEAIRGNGDTDQNKEVTTKEMYEYTRKKTLEFAQAINRKQTPVKFGVLDDIVVSRVDKQLCAILDFDEDLNIIKLEVLGSLVRKGDVFALKKKSEDYTRNLEIQDAEILWAELESIHDNYSEARIIESFYENVQLTREQYRDYYAEKIAFGSVYILTQPWSTVHIDGRRYGTTPLSILKIPEGDHEIEFEISLIGFPKRVKKRITVEENKKLRVVETFEKLKE